jgi:hypothetical protein
VTRYALDAIDLLCLALKVATAVAIVGLLVVGHVHPGTYLALTP